jgi:exopolysaccharide biosynthesis WecB/TagA/CpsF family protein
MSLLGIDFSNVTEEAVVRRVLARPIGARFTYIVTPNADHIDRLLRIPRLRAVYQRAMLCLLDSWLIALVASLFGMARPEVVTGAGLTAALLPRLFGLRVAIIGMTDADFAALCEKFPKIWFVRHAPPMALLDDDAAFQVTVEFVCKTQADFTFFAVGSPVQELLAFSVAARPEATGIGLCIGSALEFVAGAKRRAPLWMTEHGLEWVHRLALEPLRLSGRYLLADPRVLVALSVAALRQKIH